MNDIINKSSILKENSRLISEPDNIFKLRNKTSESQKNHYYVKEELDSLLGPVDFSQKLEQVNYIIGIFVSLLLIAYVIL